jgi:hypothetical protein
VWRYAYPSEVLFDLGRLYITPNAARALRESRDNHFTFFSHHARGIWGDIPDFVTVINRAALVFGGNEIRSSYLTDRGETIWVITAADRSETWIVMSDEA